jgi:proline iminopeptidase
VVIVSFEEKDKPKIIEGYIPVTGGNIWYKIVGINRKNIPLLVLHGGPGAPHDYLEPFEILSDERPVIFYDQLGCGNSDKPRDASLWNVERFVNELEQVRTYLGLDKMHLHGQSWGSMLAVEFMLTKKPKGVVSLILSGPCLSLSRFAADQRAYQIGRAHV